MKFQGKDWYLVRRKADPKGGWHPVNDNAQGSAAYGTYEASPLGTGTFSVMYQSMAWKNMLMASGDKSMWVTVARKTVESFRTINCRNCVLPLTGSSNSKSARQYMRQGNYEDPWISAVSAMTLCSLCHRLALPLTQCHCLKGHHPTHIVYGERSGGHSSDDALNVGGANVWVDSTASSATNYDTVKGYAHMKASSAYLPGRLPD